MIYKSFRFKVILRLILISLSLGLFVYYVFVTGQYLRSGYFLTFSILTVIELFWFIDRTNRDLSNFFEAILQTDFTTTFTRKKEGKSFEKLYLSLNLITEKFRQIGADKEAQYHYLEMILQQVRIGVLTFDSDGKISMANDSLRKLTGLAHLSDLKVIDKISPALYNTFVDIGPNENKLIKTYLNGQLLHLSILSSSFRMHDKDFKLITIQNIRNELEAGEVEAWQKLIRVLTHEIMNSVTPITSLTDTLLEILDNNNKEVENAEISKNVHIGLMAIKDRSHALNRFTKSYQSLTRIPEPNFSTISAKEFTSSLQTLFNAEMASNRILFEVKVLPEELKFVGDKELLGQVVINLIRNSMQALETGGENDGQIKLFVTEEVGVITISVEDNGPGIPEDRQDKIFVPFFTTRKNGSGIGLALARQIVRLHNGTIKVDSREGEFTRFVISI